MIPTTTEWMKGQMDHTPSRKYAEQIVSVVNKSGYKSALEIGCAWGISTLAILIAGKGKLISVDKSIGTHAPEEVEANGFGERWRFIHDASEFFWQKNQEKFDLIYIDGSHLYGDVKNDLFQAWEILEDGGILLLDDYMHPKNIEADMKSEKSEYGVSLAAWELVHAKKIKTVNTLDQVLWFKK